MGSIKLEKYKEKFLENGVEDMETILELKEEHVEHMGIPLGHKLKIIKRIKDIRQGKGMNTVPQSREGTARKEKPDSAQERIPQNVTQGASPAAQKSSLKDGAYDEGESHNQFLEALNAWRSAGAPSGDKPSAAVDEKTATTSSIKKVRFND